MHRPAVVATRDKHCLPGWEEPSPLRVHRILRPGLSLQLGSETTCEASARQTVVGDYIRIVLVLEGAIDVSYGRSRVQLVSGRGPASIGDVAMVTMLEPEECRRVVREGETSRRISIGLARAWVEESLGEASRSFALPGTRHLDTNTWRASARTRELAGQLMRPPPMQEHVLGMYMESRAIELVIDALTHGASAEGGTKRPRPLRPAVYRRMMELKAWLGENASSALCVEQIAAHMNTTPTTLQRHFRLAHGVTIFEYLQGERLRQARHALEHEGVSVGNAAALAGFTNQSSFTTAFKRVFGLSPRHFQRVL